MNPTVSGNNLDGWVLVYYDQEGNEHRVKFGGRPKEIFRKPPKVSKRRLARFREKTRKA